MTEFASTEQEEAARAIRDLAVWLQDFLYYNEGFGVSDRSRNILEAAYKPLKRATDHYYGDDSPLYYEGKARGSQFRRTNGVNKQ